MNRIAQRVISGTLTTLMLCSVLPQASFAENVSTVPMSSVVTTPVADRPHSGLYPGYSYNDGTGATVTIGNEYYAFMDTTLPFEERAADLVSRMTLEEKQEQLVDKAIAIPRLGVPAYDWWAEALHGIARNGKATSWPTGLGIAATWDPELIAEMMSASSDEGRQKFNSRSDNKGLNYWSPTINMARDPRWGRVEESYGEDPFLAGQIANGFILGLQGDANDKYLKSIATSKHFLANNSEYNRHTGSSNIDDRTLREYYGYAFKTTVEEGNVGSVMSAYNAVNGTPVAANSYLLDELLRRTWGFDGFVVTDCGALKDVRDTHEWKLGEEIVGRSPELPTWDGSFDGYDGKEWTDAMVTAAALSAGVDVNCGNGGAVMDQGGMTAVEDGIITEGTMDVALVRLFTSRMMTGEFDPASMVPYAHGEYMSGQIQAPDHVALAEQASDEAVTLLKNEPVEGATQPILPLNGAEMDSVVLVGPHANQVILGDYSTNEPQNTSTPVAGIRKALERANPDATFTYITGESSIPYEFLKNVQAPILYGADGEEINNVQLPTDTAAYSGCKLDAANNSIGWQSIGVGSYVALGDIDFSGVESITIGMGGQNPSLAPTTVTLMTGGLNGQVLATATSDSEKTGSWTTFERIEMDLTGLNGGYASPQKDVYMVVKYVSEDSSITLTDDDIETIKNADAVIAYGGTLSGHGGDSGESADRSSIALPRGQSDMIKELAAMNPNTIAYLQTVGQVSLTEFEDDVPAIFWCTYNGQAQGNAAGRLLFGESNPNAKLTFSWYSDIGQLDALGDYTVRSTNGTLENTMDDGVSNGRSYQYFTGDITYPFGYGLSYSSYEYSNLNISKSAVTPDDTITVTFDVTNTSAVDGKEIAQVYITSPGADKVDRPAKQLKGFDKRFIPAGDTVSYSIDIPVSDLYFCDEETGVQLYDQGTYTLEVGANCDDANALTETFTLSGDLTTTLKHVTATPTAHELSDEVPTIETLLTASNNDQSFVDLDNATVSYESSQPGVATVDANGTVTKVSSGTATITATVTSNGVTESDSFAVVVAGDVTPLAVDDITVNGTSIADFAANDYTYEVATASWDVLPTVAATAPDGCTVEVTQATGADNAEATVLVSKDGISKTYVIRFVMKVMAEGIYFDGVAMEGFDEAVYSYEFNLGDFENIPQVSAVGGTFDITVKQATADQPEATITVASANETKVYTIRFIAVPAPQSTDFTTASEVPDYWEIFKPSEPANWRLDTGEGLVLKTVKGDLFNSYNDPNDVFLQPVSGDWVMETKVHFASMLNQAYQQAGLLVYQDIDNYLKLGYESSGPGTNKLQFGQEYNGSFNGGGNDNVVYMQKQNLWYRLTKVGTTYTAEYSTNGTDYIAMGNTQTANYSNPKVGFIASSGFNNTNIIDVTISHVNFSGGDVTALDNGLVMNNPVVAMNATEGYTGADAKQTITITNQTDATISNFAASFNSDSFELAEDISATTLDAGASATIAVQPKEGLAEGAYADNLKITADGYTVSAKVAFDVDARENFVITYDNNGGTGSMTSDIALAGEAFALPADCGFEAPENMQFKGWALEADATTVIASHTFTEATTVYAIWEEIPVITYAVAIAPAVNGTVSVDNDSVAEGATVTITATPATGYEVDELIVSGDVTVTNGTFTMPAEAVTVTVTFKEIYVAPQLAGSLEFTAEADVANSTSTFDLSIEDAAAVKGIYFTIDNLDANAVVTASENFFLHMLDDEYMLAYKEGSADLLTGDASIATITVNNKNGSAVAITDIKITNKTDELSADDMNASTVDIFAAANALADAKAEAFEQLENYADPDDYRDAQKAELSIAIANGKTDITEAPTVTDVTKALADAKTAIDAIPTAEELEDAEFAKYDLNDDGKINYSDITSIVRYFGHEVDDDNSKYNVNITNDEIQRIGSDDYLAVYAYMIGQKN